MWIEILCGLIVYKLVKRFLYVDDLLELDSCDSSALFSVATKLEKVYGGKAHVGLKIPDGETGKAVGIDIVLVSDARTAYVVCVKNVSGFVRVNPDGSWVCDSVDLGDPLEHVRTQASVLQSYLQHHRGLPLPPHYFSCKLILPNPNSCALQPTSFPAEVVTYEQWSRLKPGPTLSGWIKGALRNDSLQHNLNSILATAPMWDRLELKPNKRVLGEFLQFKGNQQDLNALSNIKRSKVGRFLIQSTSMLGFAPSRLQLLYTPRDYRTQGDSSSEWKEISVRSSTELLFHPLNSPKLRKFKLSSIVSLTLSA